jgi:hypothetical protein
MEIDNIKLTDGRKSQRLFNETTWTDGKVSED